MRLIGTVFLLLIVGVVLAIKYLPWWAIVGGFLLLIVLGKLFTGRIIEAAFKMPFKAKGAVLRGATTEIHSLNAIPRPADRPASTEEGQEAEADDSSSSYAPNCRFYALELTITPAERDGGAFQLWAPGELCLVSPNAKPDDTDEDGDLCTIRRVEVADERGEFAEDEGMKYGGPQRLRLTLAASPEARDLQFRYYLELFGKVSLPA